MKGPEIVQRTEMPRQARPVVLVGAGGIVRDAHLPAYERAAFPVAGIFDVQADRAAALAAEFGVHTVYRSLDHLALTAPQNAVYDLAVPPSAIAGVLDHLPEGAVVLIQKPPGATLAEARAIADQCRRKKMLAAVNLQLRYAPCILGAGSLLRQGLIGEVHDFEVRITGDMPWHLWPFLREAPRVEVLYHSMHYLDLARCTMGEPRAVVGMVSRHPAAADLADTRCQVMLDYGDGIRAAISAHHGHRFGRRHQESFVKWEGTRGAIRVQLGMLLNYPDGEPDALEYCMLEDKGAPAWRRVKLAGEWFPDGFIGPMAALMRYAEGSAAELPHSVEDGLRTMALVEAVYESSAAGGAPRVPRG